jgi:hypothetical protein
VVRIQMQKVADSSQLSHRLGSTVCTLSLYSIRIHHSPLSRCP